MTNQVLETVFFKQKQVSQLNDIFTDDVLEDRLIKLHNSGAFVRRIDTLEDIHDNSCIYPSTFYLGLIKQINRYLKENS